MLMFHWPARCRRSSNENCCDCVEEVPVAFKFQVGDSGLTIMSSNASSAMSRSPTKAERSNAQMLAAKFRVLRRNPAFAPRGESFPDLVHAFLPLVRGMALALIPEHVASADPVAQAVFRCLMARYRKPPRRSFVAVWLVRTTMLAVARERKVLRLPRLPAETAARERARAFGKLTRLRPLKQVAVIIRDMAGHQAEEGAGALRIRLRRYLRLADSGINKLAGAARLSRLEVRAFLSKSALPVLPATEVYLLAALEGWGERPAADNLVRGVLRSWRWICFKGALKKGVAAFALLVLLLAGLAGVVGHFFKQGYLTMRIIEFTQRQLAKELPEILQPARPWPVLESDKALVNRVALAGADDLYGLTNIWTAHLSFTAEQWERMQPSRIRPVPNLFQEGRIALRNPLAQRSGLAGAVGLDFNWVEGDLELGGLAFPKVAVRYRGNGTYLNSLFGPKQSFKVDLNKFVKGQKLGRVDKLNLLNSIADFSYLHDALAEQLFADLGVPAPRTAYAYLTVDVQGVRANHPLGLYVMVENVDDDFAGDRFGSKRTPIYKPVTYDLFLYLGEDWDAYADVYDLKTKATEEENQRVIDFARLITHADESEFARRLPDFLDLQNFAAFLAGHVLMASYDGFLSNGQNYYLYLDRRSNRFGFIPWDQDHGWGELGYIGTKEQREQASIWQPGAYRSHFLNRVMQVEDFRDVYRRTLEEALDGIFTVEWLFTQIDQVAGLIRPAVAAESDFRLARFDQAVSSTWLPLATETSSKEGPKAPVHQIKRFIEKRIQSVRAQLEGESEGVRLGG
jgi:hypothetical protein